MKIAFLTGLALGFVALVFALISCSNPYLEPGPPPGGYYQEFLREKEEVRLNRVIKKALEEHDRDLRFRRNIKVFD